MKFADIKGIAKTTAILIAVVVIIIAAVGVYYVVYYEPAPSEAEAKIAVVSDVGGRGDLSFNDMAFKGGEEAGEDFGYEMIEIISKTADDYLPNLRVGADDPDTVLIVGVGYLLSEALLTVAQEYPEKNFAGIDTYTQALAIYGELGEPLPNMMDIAYEERKGSAMVGALGAFLAAYYDKPHIGGVFGESIRVLYKFEI